MRMKICTLVAAIAMTAVASWDHPAEASNTYTYANSVCQPMCSGADCTAFVGSLRYDSFNGQWQDGDSNDTLNLDCPVPNASTAPGGHGATQLNVYGYANTVSPTVKVCVTYAAGSGGTCSIAYTTSASNNVYNISPASLTVWTGDSSTTDAMYVFVALSSKDGSGGVESLFSYTMTQ
jgi:hypothetical protein